MDAMPPSGRALAALLALVSACGVFDGLTSGALYGEAGVLAPRYTQAIATGNSAAGGRAARDAGWVCCSACLRSLRSRPPHCCCCTHAERGPCPPAHPAAGVIVSLLRAATKATLPPTPDGLRASAHLYFGLAAAACAACTLLYAAVLPRLPVVRRRREAALAACLHSYDELPFRDEAAEEEAGGAGDALETVASLRAATPAPRARHASVAAGLPRGHGVDVELSAEDPAGLGGGSAAEPLLGQQQQQQHGPPGAGSRSSRAVTAAAVLRRIWPLAAANAVIFM